MRSVRRAASRVARRTGSVVVAPITVILVVGTASWGGSPATAQTTAVIGQQVLTWSGACTDSTGVTVVVDSTDLGRGIVQRCASWPVSSGFDALTKAGFTFTQPTRAPGFVCRIDGQPTSDPCVVTSPTSAYWGYFYAANHGSWTYSSLGASSHQPIKGGYEGWAFEKNRSRAVAPRIAPSHPVVAAAAPPSSTPAPQAPPTIASPSSAKTSSAAGGTQAKGSAVPTRSKPAPHVDTKKPKSAERSNDPTGVPASPTATTEASGVDATGGNGSSSPRGSGGDSGSPLATIAGIGVAGLLAAAGGVTAWRRRAGGR